MGPGSPTPAWIRSLRSDAGPGEQAVRHLQRLGAALLDTEVERQRALLVTEQPPAQVGDADAHVTVAEVDADDGVRRAADDRLEASPAAALLVADPHQPATAQLPDQVRHRGPGEVGAPGHLSLAHPAVSADGLEDDPQVGLAQGTQSASLPGRQRGGGGDAAELIVIRH